MLFVLFFSACSKKASQTRIWEIKKEDPKNPVAEIKTNYGSIFVELFRLSAPITVKNFIELAEGKRTYQKDGLEKQTPFYDGLTFHRVIPKVMIHGGCPLGNGKGNPGYQIQDEINAIALGLDTVPSPVNPKEARNKARDKMFLEFNIHSQSTLDSTLRKLGRERLPASDKQNPEKVLEAAKKAFDSVFDAKMKEVEKTLPHSDSTLMQAGRRNLN